jgi:hypothetical protein
MSASVAVPLLGTNPAQSGTRRDAYSIAIIPEQQS